MMNASTTAAGASTPLPVFIVEASQAIRERLVEMITAIDGTCCAGAATIAAIPDILEAHPDTVILDIRLPEGNGFDVLRALRHHAPGIQIYAVSNHATPAHRQLAYRLGASAFFDKTIEIEAMRELIAQRAAQRLRIYKYLNHTMTQ